MRPRSELEQYRKTAIARDDDSLWEVTRDSGRRLVFHLRSEHGEPGERLRMELSLRDWEFDQDEEVLKHPAFIPRFGLLSPVTAHDALAVTGKPRSLQTTQPELDGEAFSQKLTWPFIALTIIPLFAIIGGIIIGSTKIVACGFAIGIAPYFLLVVGLYIKSSARTVVGTRPEFNTNPAELELSREDDGWKVELRLESPVEPDVARLIRSELTTLTRAERLARPE